MPTAIRGGLGELHPLQRHGPNYSNGSSVYHGLSANLRKRFSRHYEFIASYTWSHAIDDSTDLQATLTPQDSYFLPPTAQPRCSISGIVSSSAASINRASRRQRFWRQVLQQLDRRSPR